VVKCREGGRTVNVCVVHAVGVGRDGFRESLGLDVVTAEDGAAWLAFVRGLVGRRLAGVKLSRGLRCPRWCSLRVPSATPEPDRPAEPARASPRW
jgi:hypothetical protein